MWRCIIPHRMLKEGGAKAAGGYMLEVSPRQFIAVKVSYEDGAVQNMWLYDEETAKGVRLLDVKSGPFQQSFTAELWHLLMTGEVAEGGVPEEMLEEYKSRYHPIVLETIEKDK